jgi:2-phosphosulfolactate phosphatase
MHDDAAAPFAQAAYQVRFAWGQAGFARLAPADLVVVVDVFGASAGALEAAERGDAAPPGAGTLAAAVGAAGAEVAFAGLRNAAAVARWVLARQHERGERTSVAVIAAGDDGYAVEDHLGAGAVIAALGDLGIDHCSPEAAVAGEGFRALRGATRHLLTASGAGRALAAAGDRDAVRHAAAVDAASVVPVLRDGALVTS